MLGRVINMTHTVRWWLISVRSLTRVHHTKTYDNIITSDRYGSRCPDSDYELKKYLFLFNFKMPSRLEMKVKFKVPGQYYSHVNCLWPGSMNLSLTHILGYCIVIKTRTNIYFWLRLWNLKTLIWVTMIQYNPL